MLALLSACARPPAVVSLELDDVHASQMAARPLLLAHHMRATFFVNSRQLDRAGYLTTSEVRQLAEDGNEIGGHTLDHPILPRLPVEEQRREVCEDREALQALGFDVQSFAYPSGAYDAVTREVVRSCGYKSARTSGGLHRTPYLVYDADESIPPRDPFIVRTHGSLKRQDDLRQTQADVRRIERTGGWLQLIFHHICDDCDEYSISEARLAALLDWLAAERERGAIRVLPVRRVIDGDLGPAPPP